MALPPKGDPRRELALTIRSTRILVWLFLLVSMISVVLLLPYAMKKRNFGLYMDLILGGGIPLLFVGFLVCLVALRQRCLWAVSLLMILYITTITGLSWMIYLGLKSGEWIIAGFFGIWLVGMFELIFYLPGAKKGLESEMLQVGQIHGFEPIMRNKEQ